MDEWIDRQARSIEEATELSLKRFQHRPDLNVRNRWLLEGLQVDDHVIQRLPDEAYAVPVAAARFLPAPLLAALRELLGELRELNDEFVGLRCSQVQVILDGDDRVADLRRRFRTWAEEYARMRLSKPNSKDRGIPFLQYMRLYGELLPHLELIAFREGSFHSIAMSQFTDYIPWLLYQRTWSDLLERRWIPGSLRGEYRVSMLEPTMRTIATGHVDLYGWNQRGDLENVLRRVPLPVSSPGMRMNRDEVLVRLQALAEDIVEMRPLLIHRFKPEKVLVDVAPDVICSWHWGMSKGIGIVPAATSQEEILRQHHARQYSPALLVLHDGRLALDAMPWLDVTTLEVDHSRILESNLQLLEALHEVLLSFYDKVDIDSILAGWRARKGQGESGGEATVEEVAASCQVLAEESGPEEGEAPSGIRPRIRTVRSQRLLGILAERLGCEVRRGKGSEIVIYREGGHHFRLGHHKRNAHVPSPVIKNLLDHVGIPFEEWLGAIS